MPSDVLPLLDFYFYNKQNNGKPNHNGLKKLVFKPIQFCNIYKAFKAIEGRIPPHAILQTLPAIYVIHRMSQGKIGDYGVLHCS